MSEYGDSVAELKFDAEVVLLQMLRQAGMLQPRPAECFTCSIPLVEQDVEILQCPACRSQFIVKGQYLMLYCPYIPLFMDAGVYDGGTTFADMHEWRRWRIAQYRQQL